MEKEYDELLKENEFFRKLSFKQFYVTASNRCYLFARDMKFKDDTCNIFNCELWDCWSNATPEEITEFIKKIDERGK